MNVNRSGFYKWLNRRSNPSHGYRWLNAKIKLDTGTIYSNNYAHKICHFLNIKSDSKHFKRYGKKVNK